MVGADASQEAPREGQRNGRQGLTNVTAGEDALHRSLAEHLEKIEGGANDDGNGDKLAGLVLADGTVVDADCVFVTPQARHPSFIDDLGVETASGPTLTDTAGDAKSLTPSDASAACSSADKTASRDFTEGQGTIVTSSDQSVVSRVAWWALLGIEARTTSFLFLNS